MGYWFVELDRLEVKINTIREADLFLWIYHYSIMEYAFNEVVELLRRTPFGGFPSCKARLICHFRLSQKKNIVHLREAI